MICGSNPVDAAVGQRVTDTQMDFKVRSELMGGLLEYPHHTALLKGVRVGQEGCLRVQELEKWARNQCVIRGLFE